VYDNKQVPGLEDQDKFCEVQLSPILGQIHPMGGSWSWEGLLLNSVTYHSTQSDKVSFFSYPILRCQALYLEPIREVVSSHQSFLSKSYLSL
jgi:hypothetical protein